MSDLRERVAQEADHLLRYIDFEHDDHRTDLADDIAGAAITAVIEELAAEAWGQRDSRLALSAYEWLRGIDCDGPSWLRAHLDAGRDGEAGT